MVGLAVGVVENGRITFLKGYGETEAGSGDPVTPDDGVPLGVGIEGRRLDHGREACRGWQGRSQRAAGQLRAGLKLPARYEYRASVGDMLSPPARPLSQRL